MCEVLIRKISETCIKFSKNSVMMLQEIRDLARNLPRPFQEIKKGLNFIYFMFMNGCAITLKHRRLVLYHALGCSTSGAQCYTFR